MKKGFLVRFVFTVGLVLILLVNLSAGAAEPVAQWTRFEYAFNSLKTYDDPLRDVKVKVEFTAPSGKKRTMLAFWDGVKVWRVRFSPDDVGRWTYKTSCSDKHNKGLHNQRGFFECVKYKGNLPFFQHGELRLSKNRRYFEHADGVPFFWLADTVWCGPQLADFNDWKVFLKDRADKEFTAIQFVLTQWRTAETDADGNPAFTGKEKIAVIPKYFQRLDKYVDAINDSGMLAVPVLLWAIKGEINPGYSLPEDQKIILAEYQIARYGAHQVIWFLGGDGRFTGEKADEWKRIGRRVFHKDQHRLATMHPRGYSWIGKEFRNEPWFSFIGYQSGHGVGEKNLSWLTYGPPSTKWNNKPNLPVINIEPCYEAINSFSYKKAITHHAVRCAAYWSLLITPTAGFTYGGHGIWSWETKAQIPLNHTWVGLASPWYVAKDLPGSFSMKYLHQFFASIDWWRLVPAPEILAEQPGKKEVASKFIAAAKSKEGDLAVVYLPEGGVVKIKTGTLNKGLSACWFHPRTGGYVDADKVKNSLQKFTAPDHNDWVLLLQKKK